MLVIKNGESVLPFERQPLDRIGIAPSPVKIGTMQPRPVTLKLLSFVPILRNRTTFSGTVWRWRWRWHNVQCMVGGWFAWCWLLNQSTSSRPPYSFFFLVMGEETTTLRVLRRLDGRCICVQWFTRAVKPINSNELMDEGRGEEGGRRSGVRAPSTPTRPSSVGTTKNGTQDRPSTRLDPSASRITRLDWSHGRARSSSKYNVSCLYNQKRSY